MKKMQQTIPSGLLIRSLLVLSVAVLLGAGCAAAPPQSSLLVRPERATTPALAELNNTLAAVALQQAPASTKDYHSHGVSVVGAVRKPGVFDISGPKTLIDLLAMADGVSEKAGSQVHLYRQGPEGRQSYVIDLYALGRSVGANVGEANLPVQG